MSTNTKLAEALRLAREWFRHEEAGEGPQVHDVIEAADEALAAHEAEQAQEPVGYISKTSIEWLTSKARSPGAHITSTIYKQANPDAALALYAAPVEQAAQAVPAGFKWVPVEPTEDMLFAAELSKPRGYRDLWAAMLAAAAPAPEAQDSARTSPAHQPVHGWTDADADAARLALELECILLDPDTPMPLASRWWGSAHEALALHRQRLASEQSHGIGASGGEVQK